MIKIFEMFAGYGGASFALKKAGIPFECVGFSEIDKYAIQCYNENLGRYNAFINNYGDATKINPNELKDFDLLTGGFPCQTFSAAGNGLGELDTRGTLFNEIIRIAEVKKPRYMLLENVKGLTFKKHKATFEKIVSEIKRIGYYVHIQILNSKNYGIPQNRERIFFVCFKDKVDFDIFTFPQKEELKIFLKDILEERVDDKYYLTQEQINRLVKKSRSFNERFCKTECRTTLCARDYKDPKIVQINNPIHSKDRIYSNEGISPTINTMQGGGLQPFVMNTITEAFGRGGSSSEHIKMVENVLKSVGSVRKLTPKECFRLMGFLNDEINLEGLSNTQQYKLAGNGWDINLVSKIFKQMFANP